MTHLRSISALAIFLCGATAILSRQFGHVTAYGILKPTTTILIIGVALMAFRETGSAYSRFVLIALVFALMGDVFLLSDDYFLYGLASFLAAHLFFTWALITVRGMNVHLPSLAGLAAFGVWYFLYLKPGLGGFTIPVAVYTSAILFMNWQALGLFFNTRKTVFLWVAVGSLLFTFSDSMIAMNKFKTQIESSGILVMSTYWLAISLFAFSSHQVKK